MESKIDDKHVVVIGAGISGLTAAFWLRSRGCTVTVLEKCSRSGGSIETAIEDGFLVELGPNSALETSSLIQKLVSELGIKDQMIYANELAQNRYIMRDGKLHPVPMSPGSFLRASLFSFKAKLRLFREPFIRSGDGSDETLSSFVERRFGREFLDYAINPFVAGVYAGDPGKLSVGAAFPKLFELEQKYGSVLKGAIAGRKERKEREKRGEVSKQAARLFSFNGGLSTLPGAIEKSLGRHLVLNSEVRSISLRKSEGGCRQYNVEYMRSGREEALEADAVIIATPAYVASRLVESLNGNITRELAKVLYPPVSMVFLGYATDSVRRSLDGFGFLVPEVEKRKILGTIWSSTIFPGRAPDGHVAFTTFVGGSRQPDLGVQPEAVLLESVERELRDFHGITSGPVFKMAKIWERAIPQYTTGYLDFLKRLEAFEREHPGLFFCANFRGGISVADCIQSAARSAASLGKFIS